MMALKLEGQMTEIRSCIRKVSVEVQEDDQFVSCVRGKERRK
jgi:hypothetical protein